MHTDMESQELIIMNKKPVSNPKYVLLSDPQMVHEEKKKWLAEQEQLRKKLEVEFHKKKQKATVDLDELYLDDHDKACGFEIEQELHT